MSIAFDVREVLDVRVIDGGPSLPGEVQLLWYRELS